MTILALDPGGTTGYASLSFAVRDISPTFTCGQIGPNAHYLSLWELVQVTYPSVVVCESFEYRNKERPGLVLDSVEYIGIVRLWWAMYSRPREDLVMQTASMGKGFVKDKNIKRLGLWVPGQQHAMDAYRHLLYYLTKPDAKDQELRNDLLMKGWRE